MSVYNTYRCLCRNSTEIVQDTSTYNAQIQAFNIFQRKHPRRKIKAHEISVFLVELAGEEYEYSTGSLG